MLTITGVIKPSVSKIEASESMCNRFVKIFAKFCFALYLRNQKLYNHRFYPTLNLKLL